VSKSGSPGRCRAAHEKPTGHFPYGFVTTPLQGSRRLSAIIQRGNGFMPPRQYCSGGARLAVFNFE
jgi:hypothetical protein